MEEAVEVKSLKSLRSLKEKVIDHSGSEVRSILRSEKELSKTKLPERAPEKWHRFKILTPVRAILRGTSSTMDKRFKILSRGRQECAAAAVAVVIGHLFQSPDWTSGLVDKVLEYGDRVFRVSQARCKLPDDAYLTSNLLQNEFFVGDYKCQICVECGTVYGNLASEAAGAPKLCDGVHRFFEIHQFGIITTQGMSVAIWKHDQDGYFCFDPAPTDETGKRCLDGFACLIRSPTVQGIVDVFSENLNCKHDSRYCIDRVSLTKVKPICRPVGCNGPISKTDVITVDKKTLQNLNPEIEEQERNLDCTLKEKPKPPPCDEPDETVQKIPLRIEMTNYAIEARFANQPLIDQTLKDDNYSYDDTKVNVPATLRVLPDDPNVAILHGWTHAFSDIYKAKGAQVLTTSVMAIAYKRIHPVRSWIRESVDEVLVLGTNAYEEVKTTKPSIKHITAADLDDMKFKIEDHRIIIDSDVLTIVGTFVSKNPLIINLKYGLEEFFLKNTDGVLESGPISAAIWFEDDYYYMMDAVQCDHSGLHLPEVTGKPAPGEKKRIGKSCVMRFASLTGLYCHFMSNIDSSQNFSRWSIKRINILDDIPGIRDWYGFKAGEPAKNWILFGTLNNDDESFDEYSRGMQGLAMPIAALVTVKLFECKKWWSDEVDDIVREGDAYYRWCIPPTSENNEDQTLTMKSLKKFMYYKNRKTELSIKHYVLFGEIKPEEYNGVDLDLRSGLESFLEQNDSGILEVGVNQFFVVWKQDEELKDGTKEMGYYIFLPHPTEAFLEKFQREEEESPPPGNACVIRYLDLNYVVDVIIESLSDGNEDDTLNKSEYAIHDIKPLSIGEPMTDEEIEKDKAIPIMPEFKDYKPKGNYGAVLGGSCTQTDEAMFKRMTRDKQQAANSLVALMMSKLFSPHLWSLEMVDDILRMGNRMTEDNLKNLADPIEGENNDNPRPYLLPSEINGEFNVGVNQFTITINEETSSPNGKLSDLAKVLEDFFVNNKMGVLRLEEIMMPIWKEDIAFFVMDPRGKESGNASVYWFLDIQELSDLITQICTYTDKPYGDFVIDVVNIEHRVEETERIIEEDDITEEHWYKFVTVEDGVWKIDCGVTLEDDRFKEENRGHQKAAVCVMALIFSKVYEPRHFTAEVLDEIVITGNKLHTRSAARIGTGEALLPRDIVTEFYLANRRINLDIHDCVESGKIQSHSPSMRSIGCGVTHFFRKHSMGCLVINEMFIFAMWKVDEHVYFFNPGVDLMRYEDLGRLIENLKSYTEDYDFEITSIEIVDWNKLPPWKYDPSPAVKPSNLPPMNAYSRLPGKARAILRASTHQAAEIFAEDIRNRQTASNCVVALAMSVIRNPVSWVTKTLDEILVVGVNLHRESLKVSTKLTGLKPRDLVRIFKLGVHIFAADIQNNVVTGVVTLPPPEPEKPAKGKNKDKKGDKKGAGKKGAEKKGAEKKEKKDKRGIPPPPPPPPPIVLEDGIKNFFEDHHAGILIVGRYMVAIWRDSGVFFVYDPKPRNEHGIKVDNNTPEAASCVIWFACLEPLYELIFNNINEEDRLADFEICSVIVKTIPIEPLPTPAGYRAVHEDKMHVNTDCPIPPILPAELRESTNDMLKVDLESCFRRLDKEISIMLGHIHIGDDRVFSPDTRGLQSTAVGAVVVVVASLHAPSTWTPDMIDAILKNGDTYFVECARCFQPGSRNLTMDELFEVFVVGDVRARIKVFRNFTAGVTIEADLRNSLELFFEKNSAGIMHTADFSLGLVKHWGKFYFLDPTDRNKFYDGYEGAACLVKCETICTLTKAILKICSFQEPTVYTLNVIRILDLHFYTKS